MNSQTKRSFCAVAAVTAFCISAIAAESDSASISSLASDIIAGRPDYCLGNEVIPYIGQDIRGREAIADARRSWESLRTIAEQQTAYTVEVNGTDVLIRPKNDPAIHDGPVVMLPVMFETAPRDWRSLEQALRGLSFEDKTRHFQPGLFVMKETYPADHPVQLKRELLAKSEALYLKAPSAKGTKLSDVLFLIARMGNSNAWYYEASERIIINGKLRYPRQLTNGTLSFVRPSSSATQ